MVIGRYCRRVIACNYNIVGIWKKDSCFHRCQLYTTNYECEENSLVFKYSSLNKETGASDLLNYTK